MDMIKIYASFDEIFEQKMELPELIKKEELPEIPLGDKISEKSEFIVQLIMNMRSDID
jgi:hypothetical protein